MSKDRKLLIFTIILSVITIALTIYRYEKLLKTEKKDFMAMQKIVGGVSLNKEYSAEEMISLIKKTLSTWATLSPFSKMEKCLAQTKFRVPSMPS